MEFVSCVSTSASSLVPAMPKVVVARKVTTIRGAPVDAAVGFKTVNRVRTKTGRAASTNIKSTLSVLPPEPTPPSSSLPDLYPIEPESEDEQAVLVGLGSRKGPSKAVSVSSKNFCTVRHALNQLQTKLTEWIPWREEFLDEILRLEGLSGRPLVCACCQGPGSLQLSSR